MKFKTYDEAITFAENTGKKYAIVVGENFVFVLTW